MNRREFLQRAALAVAALGIDPEQLLWTPKPMITVPAMPLPRYIRTRSMIVGIGNPVVGHDWIQRQFIDDGSRVVYSHLEGSDDRDTWTRMPRKQQLEALDIVKDNQRFTDDFAAWAQAVVGVI